MRDSRLWSDLLVGLGVLGLAVYLTVQDVTALGLLRLVVAFAALLFVPGYAAAAALFPHPRDTDLVSRLALTLGLSVAAVPLTALLLNIARWKITPGSTAVLLLLLTLALSAVALVRRLRAEEPQLHGLLRNRYSRRVLLAFAAVLAGTLLVGALTTGLRDQASYTEFYALGSQGRLERSASGQAGSGLQRHARGAEPGTHRDRVHGAFDRLCHADGGAAPVSRTALAGRVALPGKRRRFAA